MDFSSQTLRHLKLVSRLYPLKDRELYVEKHLANLLKLSLPSEILQIVEHKEAIYRNFSASELIDPHFFSNVIKTEISKMLNLKKRKVKYKIRKLYFANTNFEGIFRRNLLSIFFPKF